MRREELLLLDIIEAADAIRRFLAGVAIERFLRDDQLQSSVLLKLIIIGEAAAKLPAEFRAQHRDIEWSDVVGFRNILVHEYFALRWPTVWETATADVPKLRQQVASILAAEYPQVKLPESGPG